MALAAAQMGIFDWDLVTNHITWSRGHEELWGYGPGEFAGNYESFACRVHPDDLPIVTAEVQRSRESREPYSCEYRVIWPDGSTHWVSGTGEFEYDGTGQPHRMRGVVMEVTARKLLEQKYLQAQKLESIGQLAGGVAHDFNNLLTVIKGHAELAMHSGSIGNDLRFSFNAILDAATRAAHLTRQLLAFSRNSVTNPIEVNLNTIIAESESLVRRLAGEEIRIVTILDPSIGSIRADPGQICQLLMNLASNSRDAIDGYGTINISTYCVDVENSALPEPASMPNGKYVVLSFSDDGAGIPPELITRIFEPFFTTKSIGKGTGLGLSVVNRIAKQCNGYVDVQSERGATTFFVYFPVLEKRKRHFGGEQ